MIKYREPTVIIILSLVTGGIYFIYWLISTTKELRNLTSSAPNPWLALSFFVPFANPFLYIWFLKKYCSAAEEIINIDKKQGSLLIQLLIVPPAAIADVQTELNKLSTKDESHKGDKMATDDKVSKEALLVAKVLHIVFLSALGIYVAILILWYQEFSPILTDDSILNLITAILATLGLASIALGFFLSRWMIRRAKQKSQPSRSFQFVHLIYFASNMLVAIFGLTLGLLGAGWVITLPFLAVAVGVTILIFPTKERWRKMLE